MSNTTETPLLDLLKSVPADARMIYEHSPIESSSIPVGVLAKRAADALTAQAAEIEALRADAERLDWCLERLFTADSGWLTTDTGCGCCGEGLSFEGMTGRAAIDAALAGKAVTP